MKTIVEYLQLLVDSKSIDYTACIACNKMKEMNNPFFRKVNEDLQNISDFSHTTINEVIVGYLSE